MFRKQLQMVCFILLLPLLFSACDSIPKEDDLFKVALNQAQTLKSYEATMDLKISGKDDDDSFDMKVVSSLTYIQNPLKLKLAISSSGDPKEESLRIIYGEASENATICFYIQDDVLYDDSYSAYEIPLSSLKDYINLDMFTIYLENIRDAKTQGKKNVDGQEAYHVTAILSEKSLMQALRTIALFTDIEAQFEEDLDETLATIAKDLKNIKAEYWINVATGNAFKMSMDLKQILAAFTKLVGQDAIVITESQLVINLTNFDGVTDFEMPVAFDEIFSTDEDEDEDEDELDEDFYLEHFGLNSEQLYAIYWADYFDWGLNEHRQEDQKNLALCELYLEFLSALGEPKVIEGKITPDLLFEEISDFQNEEHLQWLLDIICTILDIDRGHYRGILTEIIE